MNKDNTIINKYEYDFRNKIVKIDDKIITFFKTKWFTIPYHYQFNTIGEFFKFQDLTMYGYYSKTEVVLTPE